MKAKNAAKAPEMGKDERIMALAEALLRRERLIQRFRRRQKARRFARNGASARIEAVLVGGGGAEHEPSPAEKEQND